MHERSPVPIPGTERNIWPGSRRVERPVPDTDVILTAWLRPARGADLDRASARILGGTLPLHRTYADRMALARTTGADPADIESLRRYCEGFGLRIVRSHWRSVDIGGPIEQLVRAFGATVAIVEDGSRRRFRHRSGPLHVPADVARIVRGVFGLHEWPRSQRLAALERRATPLDARHVADRYCFPDADGDGQTIGVVQLRGIYRTGDFDQCMRVQGLVAAHPIIKRVDNAAVDHKIATTKDLEAALDVQIIASLVPRARIVVYEASDDERGFLNAIRDAIFDEHFAPSVLSISYGWPEFLWTPVALDLLDELFAVAALVGVSVFCSSGDHGAELEYDGKPHVLAPASSPFAIACGATSVGDDAEERAWEKTGGGFSERFDLPPWQDVARASASQYGLPVGRGLPDVAAQQHPGYFVVVDGIELAIGGTSAIAPMWSALTARINQRLGVPVGFFTPRLYERAERCCTDISGGSNGLFRATAGWDPCTGLGVPVGRAIEEALSGLEGPQPPSPPAP